MHHRIPKLLGTHVHHDAHKTQACNWNVQVTLTGQRSNWEMFDRTVSKMYAVHCCFCQQMHIQYTMCYPRPVQYFCIACNTTLTCLLKHLVNTMHISIKLHRSVLLLSALKTIQRNKLYLKKFECHIIRKGVNWQTLKFIVILLCTCMRLL